MVHSVPMLSFLVPFKEGELGYPQEVELALGDNIQLACALKSQSAERCKSSVLLVGDDKYNVALFSTCRSKYLIKLALAEELAEGAVGSVLDPADISKTLYADALDIFGQLVDLFSCESGSAALCGDAANSAAVCDSGGKYSEAAVLNNIGRLSPCRNVYRAYRNQSAREPRYISFWAVAQGYLCQVSR